MKRIEKIDWDISESLRKSIRVGMKIRVVSQMINHGANYDNSFVGVEATIDRYEYPFIWSKQLSSEHYCKDGRHDIRLMEFQEIK